MAIIIIIFLLAVFFAVKISKGKTKKSKLIIWGISTILVIGPFLAWIIGIISGIIIGDGFAGAAVMVILFFTLLLVGLILILSGIFHKEKIDNNNPKDMN